MCHMLKVFSGTQLAIGDIDKVLSAQDLPEPVYIVSVHCIICAVSAVNFVGYGNGSVRSDIKAKDELF